MWNDGYRPLVETGGLQNARDGHGVGPTWPSILPIGVPIDHILATRDVALREFRVLRGVGSDHLPISAEFSMWAVEAQPPRNPGRSVTSVLDSGRIRDYLPVPAMSNRDSQGLRHALAQFATGVTIVTTAGPAGEPIGVTANSFNSISLDLPLVLWSLSAAVSRDSRSKRPVISACMCSRPVRRTFRRNSHREEPTNSEVSSGSRGSDRFLMFEEFVARFQCRLTHQYPIGDHLVFVGEVLHFDKSDKRPLVFHGGRYALAERRKMAKLARELSEKTPSGEERRQGRESKR